MDTNIYLFVGVMATILGFSLVVYAIILYVAYRRKAKRYVDDIDVVSVREWEADLQLTAPMTAPQASSSTITSNPFDALTAGATPTVPSTPQAPPPIATVPTPVVTTPSIPAPTHHQQILVALEQLVKQHHMGLIDDSSYQQRKLELFGQLAGISGSAITAPNPVVSDEPKTYTSYEELLLDFTEGIITAKEFEQHKAQFNQ